jgi:hypothetical protein
MVARLTLLAIAGTILFAGVFPFLDAHSAANPPSATSHSQSPSRVADASTRHTWLGAGSCGSMGCHNANGLKGELRSEYTTWAVHDTHARAYETLFNNKSRLIAKNLQFVDGKSAWEQSLCLNCHVHREYEQANHHSRFAREDGVSCEACHGPAGDWISEHYKPKWQALALLEKNQLGMSDTRSIAGRVRTCTPCHVGAAGMDVNHDLIAAGHPRLAFEFTAYHALMPHHWQDAKDNLARPDWDAAAWLLGESITTKAALELLSVRAGGKTWPEFAEYDCYACHHQLQNQSWRQQWNVDSSKRRLLPWNDWSFGQLPYRIESAKTAVPSKALEELATLKKIMEGRQVPDPIAVRLQAQITSLAFGPLVEQSEARRFTPEDLSSLLKQLTDFGASQKAGSWDEATKTYLAVVAVHQAAQSAKVPQPPLADALRQIRSLLQFAPGSDSPSLGYTPELLLEPYRLMRTRLEP